VSELRIVEREQTMSETERKLRLMNAAPKLLAAVSNLLAVVESLDVYRVYGPVKAHAQEAIDDAEGR
jgi:hypothetical protein